MTKTNVQTGRYVSPDAKVFNLKLATIICQSNGESTLDNEEFSQNYDFKW